MSFLKTFEEINIIKLLNLKEDKKILTNDEKYEKLISALDKMFQVSMVKVEKWQSYNARKFLLETRKYYDNALVILERRSPEKINEFKGYIQQKLEQLHNICVDNHDVYVIGAVEDFQNHVTND